MNARFARSGGSFKQKFGYRVPLSASPVCKNRRCEEDESSDSEGDHEGAGLGCNYSYEGTPQDIIENEIDGDSQNETFHTAATYDEDGDPNYLIESTEDIKKMNM